MRTHFIIELSTPCQIHCCKYFSQTVFILVILFLFCKAFVLLYCWTCYLFICTFLNQYGTWKVITLSKEQIKFFCYFLFDFSVWFFNLSRVYFLLCEVKCICKLITFLPNYQLLQHNLLIKILFHIIWWGPPCNTLNFYAQLGLFMDFKIRSIFLLCTSFKVLLLLLLYNVFLDLVSSCYFSLQNFMYYSHLFIFKMTLE